MSLNHHVVALLPLLASAPGTLRRGSKHLITCDYIFVFTSSSLSAWPLLTCTLMQISSPNTAWSGWELLVTHTELTETAAPHADRRPPWSLCSSDPTWEPKPGAGEAAFLSVLLSALKRPLLNYWKDIVFFVFLNKRLLDSMFLYCVDVFFSLSAHSRGLFFCPQQIMTWAARLYRGWTPTEKKRKLKVNPGFSLQEQLLRRKQKQTRRLQRSQWPFYECSHLLRTSFIEMIPFIIII